MAPVWPHLGLVERALDLARILRHLLPCAPDVASLLALILLTDARRAGRLDQQGRLVLLADQDRSRWDRAAMAEGVRLLEEAITHRSPGRYTLMAAIAAVHDQAPTWQATDWRQIIGLYDKLVELWPSPVVALNRAVALGFAHGAEAGLAALDALQDEPQLAGYPYLAAARAYFLTQLDQPGPARLAYQEAALLTENTVQADFLTSQLPDPPPPGR